MRVVKNYMSYIEKQKAHHSSTHKRTKEMLAFVFHLVRGLVHWLDNKPCLILTYP